MNILFLTNVPSPYRVQFFNELAKKCNLTVLYQRSNSSERDSKWFAASSSAVKNIFLKGKKSGVDNGFCPSVVKYLNRNYDYIVICGISSPTEMLAIKWCQIKRLPYCIEGDGAFAKDGSGFKEKLKKNLIKKAFLFFSTCKEHDKYYVQYGAEEDRIVRYRFSSLNAEDIDKDCTPFEQKLQIRQQLDMTEEKIILSVGRFSNGTAYRKGYDILLKMAESMPDNVGIYIVGEEPTQDYIQWKEEKDLSHVHFVGFKIKEELKMYYRAADMFVLPTREDIWGLVINEAMAYGLAVVTTDRCNAGLELISNDENGYIVPIENEPATKEAVLKTLDKAEWMGRSALETIREYTIENMALDHVKIFVNNQEG